MSGGKYYGWADAMMPYTRTTHLFHCPRSPSWHGNWNRAPRAGNYIDYFYNSNLEKQERISDLPFAIVMLGDAPPSNARSSTNGCRRTPCAAQEAGKPATLPGAADRHFSGAVYAFADSHAKWIKADSSTQSPKIMSGNTQPEPRLYTFGIK